MNMYKKTIFAALLATSTVAMADEQTELEFQLEANIPAQQYFVEFQDPAFGTTTQTMAWDNVNEKLEEVSTTLLAKNNVGKITAHLDSAAALSKGADTIPLTVSIDSKALPVGATGAVEIVDAATSTTQSLQMKVAPTGTPTYVPGDYTGAVKMMFDFELP
ncbi:fimbrial protein [Enterobacter bugandensis]|uniref:fimbrial protein n=1 Tax=Enterobacter bugandensis TaxID=881260 RepID=UPI0021D0E758|nr:fimbrial protein [Enterobacter bugandensis]MCU6159791.1 fimbrial protein [Enterobacter bugandensis]MCU6216056.1 fimbrial protein [Enterobacter bugandensis]